MHLFRPLEESLINLLESLSTSDWIKPTIAGQWLVKDVAAHLLDGNIKALSMQRDRYFGEQSPSEPGYQGLVEWLNQLNANWIKAAKRISPEVLLLLHKSTGIQACDYFESLDPWEEAIFPVDWAGESKSYNWMHMAREFSEKWHHQQQIRDATGREGIMTRELFIPFINTYFMALPHTFRNVAAKPGTNVRVIIPGELGGDWFMTKKEEGWLLTDEVPTSSESSVEVPPEISWKLFSKNLRPSDIIEQVRISGDTDLGTKVLEMVSVMA